MNFFFREMIAEFKKRIPEIFRHYVERILKLFSHGKKEFYMFQPKRCHSILINLKVQMS